MFCFTRILATIIRIAWACHPNSVRLDIAEGVIVEASIVLLYLANLVFAQRLLRAQHPRFGWTKSCSVAFLAAFGLAFTAIIHIVVALIASYYSADSPTLNAILAVHRFGSTVLAVVALVPLTVVLASSLARRHFKKTQTIDKFGEGSMRTKVIIVLVSATTLSLGAWYRAGTVLARPVPAFSNPHALQAAPQPAYLSKGCFYVFNFTLEILVCFGWIIVRVDKRFRIPDGAQGPFSYANGFVFAGETGYDRRRASVARSSIPGQKELQVIQRQESWRSSRVSVSSRQSRQMEVIENRISWGGVSHGAIAPAVAEDGVHPIPYQIAPEEDTAEDVGVDGVGRELGWDPKTGRWAVRPVSGVHRIASRPSSIVYNAE